MEEIRIEPPDPDAARKFARERELILPCFDTPPLAIEHFGSTAIPGLAAKPIIDIAVLVTDLAGAQQAVPGLMAIGYVYSSGPPAWPRIVLVKGAPRSHHLHIHEDEAEFRRHIVFRDHLLGHPEDVAAYAALKITLAERFRTDREAYSASKTAFIDAVVARAGGPPRAR